MATEAANSVFSNGKPNTENLEMNADLASYTDGSEFSEPPIAGSGVWENRGLLDIIDSILLTCEDGALKTHVMYRCNLNSKQIKTYLSFLLARGLVEKRQDDQQGSRSSYVTTTRGRKYVAAYRTLLKILYVDLGKDVRS